MHVRQLLLYASEDLLGAHPFDPAFASLLAGVAQLVASQLQTGCIIRQPIL